MKRCAAFGRNDCVLFLLQFYVFYVFTDILFSVRPPGAPSFVARRKIEEKGVPKGSKAALWILAFYTGVWRGDVLTSYEFAVMQFTRFRLVRWRAVSFSFLRLRQKQTLPLCNTLRGCKHCFRRTLAYCSNCGKHVGTQRITNVIQTWRLGGCVSFSVFLGTAARRGKGISGAPQPT